MEKLDLKKKRIALDLEELADSMPSGEDRDKVEIMVRELSQMYIYENL